MDVLFDTSIATEEAEHMLVVVVVVAVLAGLLKPRPSRFGRPRAVPLIFAAAATQIAGTAVSGVTRTALLVTSLALGAAWVALQRRHLATGVLAVGAVLNIVVIAANTGMPVSSHALARVGRRGTDVTDGFLYKHVAMNADTRLSWLGDVIPIPVQRNVISAGDVLMAIAICLWIADSVGAWRHGSGGRSSTNDSAGAVHGEHGRSPTREVVGDGD